MDSNLLPIINTIFLFVSTAISIISDIFIIFAVFFLFNKICKTRLIASENNREIHEHDKMFIDLQEEVDEIKHG